MKKTIVSNSKYALPFSSVILGTGEYGTSIVDDKAFEQMDYFINVGGNILDTAHVYGTWGEKGESTSELVIGKYLQSRDIRKKLFICTKGGHPPLDDMTKSRLDKANIVSDVNSSLECLQTDYIDLFLLHRDDESKPVSEIMLVLHQLVENKKVRLIGASNWSAKRIKQANEFAKINNLTPFSASQIQWSYAKLNSESIVDSTTKEMDENEYAEYSMMNIPVMSYSSQARGFFAKFYEYGIEKMPEGLLKAYGNPQNYERVKIVQMLAAKYKISLSAASLLYIVNNKISGCALISASSLSQLKNSLEIADIDIEESLFDYSKYLL